MYIFIYYIRTIATILITNSHYSSIWPIAGLAVGGLLGNVLFFAVSGFLLFNTKENFGKWYLKRFLRVYPVMIFVTLLTVLMGIYPLTNWAQAYKLFVFPTNYIFLVWLMLLYIPFYWINWISRKYTKFMETTLIIISVAWLLIYFVYIDKTLYCIDNVSQPFILFLYFISMLMGALFKKYIHFFKKIKCSNVIFLFLGLAVYFGSKVAFSKIPSISFWQIVNQMSILVVLYFLFAFFIGIEEFLKKAPRWINMSIEFCSKITLQIYLVQFVIIYKMGSFDFPLNFLGTTFTIFVVASVVYFVESFIRKEIKRGERNAKSTD